MSEEKLSQILMVENIPSEMKSKSQWVAWGPRQDAEGITREKTPINPRTGCNADTTARSSWGTFEQALLAIKKFKDVRGIGFVFSKQDPYCGIDLDGCRDPQSGELSMFAQAIVERMKSYTEISPSGKGLHIIIKGKKPGGRCKTALIEIYDQDHYFTITGNMLAGESA